MVDIQVGLEGKNDPKILVRALIPCRPGPVPPPDRFQMDYVTFNPDALSPLNVSEGFIIVHKCEGSILELSGGWDVEGNFATALELPFSPPNRPIPVKHLELTHVTATLTVPTAGLK